MPTLVKAPKGTWNLTRSWKFKVISCSKCQNKMDFYVGTCKKHDEWILHSNGQDGFGLYKQQFY
jgi:hypothetical protein